MRVEVVGTSPNLDATRDLGDVLGKDDFLKLLITKLKHQNPIEPRPDEEFISDLAQFTALEQMTNLNKNITQFLMQASSIQIEVLPLLGRRVVAEKDGVEIEGIVSKIRFEEGIAKITVGEHEIQIEDIREIAIAE